VRSRTAGVMTTLMRNGRDRRSGKPVKCHAILERVRLFGTRSADYIRASGQSGRTQRPNTWLHPNASLNCPIFPLHRGRRPYMALSVIRRVATFVVAIGATADISRRWRGLAMTRMTQLRHYGSRDTQGFRRRQRHGAQASIEPEFPRP